MAGGEGCVTVISGWKVHLGHLNLYWIVVAAGLDFLLGDFFDVIEVFGGKTLRGGLTGRGVQEVSGLFYDFVPNV